jgi:VNT family MFS transporter (synaptic vesicle glycoprotein 2)
MFLSPYTLNTLILLYVMFALCFAYYGLWMWLPELYKRMNANGGSPCTASSHVNTTIVPANRTCHIDDSIYFSSFISSMSNLPGNLFTIFFIDKLGRNIITC